MRTFRELGHYLFHNHSLFRIPIRLRYAVSLLIPVFFSLTSCSNPAEHTVAGEDRGETSDSGATFMPVSRNLFHREPSWGPIEGTIAFRHEGFVAYDSLNDTWIRDHDSVGIWFISSDGSNKRIFLNRGWSPDWSSDGQWIVFETGDIYKVRVDGDSLTQLTFTGGNYFPMWSPDGEWIAYDNVSDCSDSLPENSCGVYVISADGSNLIKLAEGRFPSWSPDGQHVIFMGEGSEIFRVKIDDPTDIVQVSSLEGTVLEKSDNRYPLFSPNGSRIVFYSSVGESWGLWIMNSDGSDLQKLADDCGGQFSWSPDGKSIVCRGLTGTLWIMDSEGSNKHQLTFRPGSR